jgi:hypothetical protein
MTISRSKKEYVVEEIQNGHVYDVQCTKSFVTTVCSYEEQFCSRLHMYDDFHHQSYLYEEM